MSERSKTVSRGIFRGVIAFALAMGAAQHALAETYTVDRTVAPGRITGTIETNGRLGVLTAADILDWNLAIDADGNGTTAALLGPLSGGNSVLTLTGTRAERHAGRPDVELLRALGAPARATQHLPDPHTRLHRGVAVAGLLSDVGRAAEGSAGLSGICAARTGLEQIATLAFRTLEITADTTLTADHRGPVVIAADNVTLDCAYQSVAAAPRTSASTRPAERA